MTSFHLRLSSVLLMISIITACGSVPAANDQASLRATVEAEVRATMAAQVSPTAQVTPTAAPTATATPLLATVTPAPTSAPVEPTRAPFAPSTDTPAPSGTSVAATAAPAEDGPVVFRPQEQTGTGMIVNIQLVFDSSGSMAQRIGDETKIQATQRAMERVINSLPDNPNHTAIVEEGRETVAIIGWGGITFVNDGLPARIVEDLRVDKAVEGKWEVSIFDGPPPSGRPGFYFQFDRQFTLAPGRYRVYDEERRAVLVDNILVEPGKSVTVRLRP